MSQNEQLKDGTEVLNVWNSGKGRGNMRLGVVCGVIRLEEEVKGGSWREVCWSDPVVKELVLRRLADDAKKIAKQAMAAARHQELIDSARAQGYVVEKRAHGPEGLEFRHLQRVIAEAV